MPSDTPASTQCGQSGANEVSQDPLQPQKCWPRQHGSMVFTFPLVTQKCSKIAPMGTLLGTLFAPSGPKTFQRTLQKINKNFIRFLMPPGSQNDPKMTLKWADTFWGNESFSGSGRPLLPKTPLDPPRPLILGIFGGFAMAGPAKLFENTRKPHCD
jgi:hypothetical protein